ncbi:MAG: PIG-L family deacetylase [Planctomycetes bacterium]|nr:PIG-L family deacetylase [Planctomycetota bacterium]
MAGKMRVLAMGAHPDDMEFLCGGTLARFARDGHEVFIAHVSNGDRGSFRHQRAELAGIRRKEAIAAAAVIGATSLTAGIPDGDVANTVENQRLVTEMIRQARPNLVIATDPNDYHGDHRAVGEMAIHCTFMATCPLYETPSAVMDKVPPIYFCDTSAGLGFQPTDWVDISDVMETKVAMMRAHESQFQWLGERPEARDGIVGEYEAINRFRGIQCGVRYAEAFRVCPTRARITPYRVLP